MKKTLLATTLLISSGLIFAAGQEVHEQKHKVQPTQQTQGEGMTEESMTMMMQKDMEKIRSQMAEIHKTVDPVKQDELIQAHLADMHKMMKMMNQMHGGNDAMMGQGSMEKRMSMMQMMMEQMIQNQQATEANRKFREKGHDHIKTK
tara:strand:+ start:251 stop:691 length:441 start_codon:yes stop_codon:yes gene_type:complete